MELSFIKDKEKRGLNIYLPNKTTEVEIIGVGNRPPVTPLILIVKITSLLKKKRNNKNMKNVTALMKKTSIRTWCLASYLV